MWRKTFFGLLFLSLLCSFSRAEYIPGEMIVRFKPGVIKLPKGMSVAATKAAAVSAVSVKTLNARWEVSNFKQLYKAALEIRPDWKHLGNYYLLSFPKGKALAQAVKEYKKDPNVEYASPNGMMHAFATTPNDPGYSQQWGLEKINAPQGWDRTTGSAETFIAVLDTGVNYNHEDLTGKINLTYAKDFVNSDNDPMDDFGHGTAVSGVIAAATNNSKGIAGVDWNAKIMPLKVLTSSGGGGTDIVSEGLVYAAALKSIGVNIVAANMSLGQSASDVELENQCTAAYNQGIVLVAAAGNDGSGDNTYPAFYSTVLAVAATGTSDARSVWSATESSNYGTWVDVSAPGTSIYSTGRQNTDNTGLNTVYDSWNGTSLASPYVAGLAGLIKAVFPSLTNAQIVNRIINVNNVDNIDAQNPGYIGKLGSGRINIYKALTGITAQITSPATGEYIKGSREIRGSANGWSFNRYLLEAIKTDSLITIESSASPVDGAVLGTWDTSSLNGEYTIRLKSFTTEGPSLETSIAVVVDNTAPEASLTAPVDGAAVLGKVILAGKARDQNIDRYTMEYGEGNNPSVFQNIGTDYVSVDGGTLGTWETSGLAGTYTIRLTAYDKAGTSATAAVSVNITPAAPTKETEAADGLPRAFALPNPFDRTATAETSFVYNLQGNFNTTLYLFDLSGNLIWRKNYLAGENGGKSGLNTPGWDGKSLYGQAVANGVYFYQITADQKVIGRGKIIVLN